jgi:hypothetical protein
MHARARAYIALHMAFNVTAPTPFDAVVAVLGQLPERQE